MVSQQFYPYFVPWTDPWTGHTSFVPQQPDVAVATYQYQMAQMQLAACHQASGGQPYPEQDAEEWHGQSSSARGKARGSQKGNWRGKNHNEEAAWNEWEGTDWHGQNWSEAQWKPGKQNRKWKSAGRKAENPSDAAASTATTTAETAGQTFYEKPKGKTEENKDTKATSASKEMDLVATTVETADEPAETSRAWRSNRVKNRKAKEKDEEKSPEKPKGKEKNGGWGDGLTREVKISKTLTQILRHKALELEIEIRPDGYCYLQKVLDCPWLSELEVTKEDVQQVVKRSDKKRFELKDEDGEVLIRAVQGHSMKVIDDNQLLQKLDLTNLPDCCVHGTYRKYFESIKSVGLLAGGGQGQGFRNHVHFSAFAPGDKRVISGMRYDCDIAIWIDLKRAIQDEVPFYMSTNQVILSPGINGIIDKKYFKRARDLHKKEDLPL